VFFGSDLISSDSFETIHLTHGFSNTIDMPACMLPRGPATANVGSVRRCSAVRIRAVDYCM